MNKLRLFYGVSGASWTLAGHNGSSSLARGRSTFLSRKLHRRLHICPLGRMLNFPLLCDPKVVFSSWQLRGPWRRRWMPLHAAMTLGLTMALRYISPADFILHILFKILILWERKGLLCCSSDMTMYKDMEKVRNCVPKSEVSFFISAEWILSWY